MKTFKVTVNKTFSYTAEGEDSMSVLDAAMEEHGKPEGELRVDVELVEAECDGACL